jgi:hypothetical protein
MVADKPTPPSGENVSDAQFDEQEYLRDHVTHRCRAVLDELRYEVARTDEVTLEHQRLAVARVRYQLELLEAVLDEELGGEQIVTVEELKQ